ncbi:Intraflagellar transport protein 46 [Chytridiales sp. JEL 0842]|nr:Intraflagellar transport protein 46 [Chytridiales sp. JEL 0842]
MSGGGKPAQFKAVSNNFYDETVEMTDDDEDEEDDDMEQSRETSPHQHRGDTPPSANMSDSDDGYDQEEDEDDDEDDGDDDEEHEQQHQMSRMIQGAVSNQAMSSKTNLGIEQQTSAIKLQQQQPPQQQQQQNQQQQQQSKTTNSAQARASTRRAEEDTGLDAVGRPKGVGGSKGLVLDDDQDLITGDDDNDDSMSAPYKGGAASFKEASTTDEMKELFQYITRYRPQDIELEPELKPFIPDFIPAIGDIDAFIKIPRPDNKPDSLGLTVLDEPAGKQSDPTVLDLHLRAVTKSIAPVPQTVRSLDSVSLRANSKPLENWIRNVKELHTAKPPPSVHYSRRMPDIEDLMQVWPAEIEEALNDMNLQMADLDMPLHNYVRLLTAILDIPTPPATLGAAAQGKDGKRRPSTSTIESLHVLFTLYSEFKNSQHFRDFGETVDVGGGSMTGGLGGPDRVRGSAQ